MPTPSESIYHKYLPPEFWSKVSVSSSGCWEWIGNRDSNGYGRCCWENKNLRTHRIAYEAIFGPVGKLVIDHLCRNTPCCNPDHLEAVSQSINIKRGLGPEVARMKCKLITHCPSGHEYTPENTLLKKLKTGGFSRSCKACHRISARKRRAECQSL